MTTKVANALYRYFETLYTLNQNLIVLCGIDAIDNRGQSEDYIDKVVQAVPRLIPYEWNKVQNSYVISDKSGLMDFSTELPFLKNDYEDILKKHIEFLKKTKKVRNKLEHRMHSATVVASSSGTMSLFSMTYSVEEQEYRLDADEIIEFVKDMNNLFSKIQTLVDQFACSNKLEDHPYYWRLIRHSFLEFNKVYESDLLRTFGKVLLPF